MSFDAAASKRYSAADAVEINRLMERLRVEDPDYRVISANVHQYSFGPPLQEEAVASFEREHGLRVPEDYRSFLQSVGNGGVYRDGPKILDTDFGAGPGCGLIPLARTARGCDVNVPFPLTVSTDIEPYPDADDWIEKTAFPGVLEICYRGGGGFCYLVVNGPMYGTIWNFEMDIEPMAVHPTGLTFGDWYQGYLNVLIEKALPTLALQRFAARVKVGMTESQVIEICGPAERRMDWPNSPYRYELSYSNLRAAFQMRADDTVYRVIPQLISTY